MDWPMKDAVWSTCDLNNYMYDERHTVVIRKMDDETVHKLGFQTRKDWRDWLEKAPSTSAALSGPQPRLLVMLCSRALPVFEGQQSPIYYLPFSRDVWRSLIKEFNFHRCITRTILRQVAYFSTSQTHDQGFTARMSAYLPDDLALSVTFFPRTSTTFAVVYGCNNAQMEEIEKRIQRAGDSTEHPLLLMGIFAELERKRLVDLADKLLDNFTLRSEHLENGIWDPSVELNATKAQENLKLCFQSRNIADHMKAVKRQLSKFLDAIDLTGKTMMGECPGDILQQKLPKREHLTNVAFQMKQRTQDIMIEYDDKINECEMVMGNTSLAMQTLWNHVARLDSQLNTRIARVNTEIVMETKRESTQMKAIALLTMAYLPLSSVASIFSMSMFNWGAGEGETVVSNYIWLFLVLSLGLTGMTVLAWRLGTRHIEVSATKEQEKRGSRGVECNNV